MKRNWKRLPALLLALAILLGLTACGKGNSDDVTGKYLCIAIAEDGVNFTAPEDDTQYIELKKGGKGEIYTDLAFDLTWKLDGESFSGSYRIFGIDAPITGTLKDSILEIHDDDVVMRYLKDGAEAPDWAKNMAAAPEKGRLAGMYTLYAMEIAGVRYDYAALVEMDAMDDSFLRIDYDPASGYTGELHFDGEEPDTFTLEDKLGMLNFSGGDQMGFYEDAPGVIGITHADLGGTIFFALDSVDRSAPETGDPLLDWWNGDWYGWWFMYGCKGAYADLEGAYWDCEAHIEIDPAAYTGTMELWDDEQYQNMGGVGMVEVSLSDNGTGAYGTLMSEGGWFEEKSLSHADWIIDPGLSDFENMLVITGDYDDGSGNVYYYKMMMRKWGELWEDVDEDSRPWSYADWYKPMIEDGVTKMSVRFGDPDPDVYADLEPKDGTPTAPENGSTGSDSTTSGEMDLEKLTACFETLRNADNKYEMLYEDVRDLMGCDGQPYQNDGKNSSYCWQSGNVIVTVTFKILENGDEECCAMFISGN